MGPRLFVMCTASVSPLGAFRPHVKGGGGSTLAQDFFQRTILVAHSAFVSGYGRQPYEQVFLRSIGVSPLVLRLSIGISTFPCVGWAIASPCITVRSLRATFSVQVHLRVEILAALRMVLYSYEHWKRFRVNSRGYGRQNCGAISPVHFLPRAVGSVSPLPGRKLLVARLGGYV